MQLIEPQTDGKDIAYKGQPRKEGQQGAVPVDPGFLFKQGLFLDVKPFLDPLPLADAAYPVGGEPSQPVAGGGADP